MCAAPGPTRGAGWLEDWIGKLLSSASHACGCSTCNRNFVDRGEAAPGRPEMLQYPDADMVSVIADSDVQRDPSVLARLGRCSTLEPIHESSGLDGSEISSGLSRGLLQWKDGDGGRDDAAAACGRSSVCAFVPDATPFGVFPPPPLVRAPVVFSEAVPGNSGEVEEDLVAERAQLAELEHLAAERAQLAELEAELVILRQEMKEQAPPCCPLGIGRRQARQKSKVH